jgi:putative ABC transport system ATP-binding protein
MTAIIEARNICRTFKTKAGDIHVLKGIDLIVEEGEFVSIMGRSGAGKSTLLYQISLLDEPSEGTIRIGGKDALALSPSEASQFRLNEFGFVFQDYALLPELTALENVALPLLMQGHVRAHAYESAKGALARVKLSHRVDNVPAKLSGGEQQRVSIARAVAHNPKILFADEPTANLDNESAGVVLGIFDQLHKDGQTIIMVTHEEEFAEASERIITIDDGKILKDNKRKSRKRV